ncbi:hypothetical protein Patl1_34835 [Pistacia atlantica]|uniref:Uncharacterized protein n=1 Tax=Pistacia atlantica TaxID=434234 RepID=A0ACC0ZPU6_9ROSI|nr:hypothetical protein Patl1_34835 [Pistacia atlantica]
MHSLTQLLFFLILQFFDGEGYKESAPMLTRESGYYFDLKLFEDLVLDRKWEEVERYLCSFTKVHDNMYSTKIYFQIRTLTPKTLNLINNNNNLIKI